MFNRTKVNFVIGAYITFIIGLIISVIIVSLPAPTKTIVVGTSPDFPPMELKEKGKLVGFDIDVMTELSKVENFNLKFKEIGFDGLISAIQNGKIDAIASGFSNTPERRKVVNFSKDYFASGNVILTTDKESNYNIKNFGDAKVGVLAGSTQLDALKKNNVSNIKVFDDQLLAIKALQSGNIDAAYVEATSALSATKNIKGMYSIEDKYSPIDSLSLAISKSNPTLKSKLDAGLLKLQSNGTLSKISIKWFGKDLYKEFKIK